MLRVRVIPCLLLSGTGLVKTVKFKSPKYVGDPVNIVRIFNELEVDELVLQDICTTQCGSSIQFDLLENIAKECFMPFAYGGGIATIEDAHRLFELGAEKIIVNSAADKNPELIQQLANRFGSQAIVASIDVKKDIWGRYRVHHVSGTQKTNNAPPEWAKCMEEHGAGEILLTSIDRDGTFTGYDTALIRTVTNAVGVPVIASGGASCLNDFVEAIVKGGASALGVGSMVVYQGSERAVLTNFPKRELLNTLFEGQH